MGVLEDWNLRHFDRYVEQLGNGQHDALCEQRERSSLCHCSKRRREAAGEIELPALEFTYPICSGCNQEVDHDGDRFVCLRCKVAWAGRAGDGDKADHFIDDYGDLGVNQEQFGQRLIVLATEDESEEA